MSDPDPQPDPSVQAFIDRWSRSGGAERSNSQRFLLELCGLLDVPEPDVVHADRLSDYAFERRIEFRHPDGSTSSGWIDLYKRGCFVLEAKQSKKRAADAVQDDLPLPLPAGSRPARKPGAGWDKVMLQARQQAESYARALPVDHGYPPFLLVADVGHVIEVYADFSGQGKNYAHFPDRRSFRIALADLADEGVCDRLRLVWTDPLSLDPAKKSAEVTRDVAERLARIARRLETKHDPKAVAEFLMRCLFTMFAEDVGLLPKGRFADLLAEMKQTPQNFRLALESLWERMDKGGYHPFLNATVKQFNGTLFKSRDAFDLEADDIHELWVAAGRDWSEVEPAIFGTLLERALEKSERSKLGAHYTPRAYVERLVIPTIIEPLRADWQEVKALVADLREKGRPEAALKAAKDFHHKLCTTRVLDPACGTGNFLYVSLELMKRLEGEVLEALEDLGEATPRFALQGETVDPHQFYGLEINPRAVAIAELVLWIGYLKWQLRTAGPESIAEPVLHAYGTIKEQDAILAYDRQELLRDEQGRPLSRWDGHTTKLHPITGEEIPDPDAQVPIYSYVNPRPAPWPDVEFIVGNPPFLGKGAIMRGRLGDGYVEAIRSAYRGVPASADYVMYWWVRGCLAVRAGKVLRSGLITTNTFTQSFNQKLVHKYIDGKHLSFAFAISDHPWVDAADGAAVRISMTVTAKGRMPGKLVSIGSNYRESSESHPFDEDMGYISADLALDVDFSGVVPLLANDLIASMGPALGSRGFLTSGAMAEQTGKADRMSAGEVFKELWSPRDQLYRWRGWYVPDLNDIESESTLRDRWPHLYQYLHQNVLAVRSLNRDKRLSRYWWKFRRSNEQWRGLRQGISRIITTPETAKHRFFYSLILQLFQNMAV